jgi:hypothetical protein
VGVLKALPTTTSMASSPAARKLDDGAWFDALAGLVEKDPLSWARKWAQQQVGDRPTDEVYRWKAAAERRIREYPDDFTVTRLVFQLDDGVREMLADRVSARLRAAAGW